MSDDLKALMTSATVDVPLAGRLFGLQPNAAYRARAAGEIPSVKVGGKFRVPSARLREMLGLPPIAPGPQTAA